jgi:DNA repair protein RecN (Recombination protein N)
LEADKAALIVDDLSYAQQLELLRFQVREISGANLQVEEEMQVEGEFNRAGNAVKLLQLTQSALGLLSEDESSLLNRAGAVGRQLREIERLDASASNLTELHEGMVGQLRELEGGLSRYAEHIDVDPARLAELEDRLNLIHALKRKYGSSIAGVIAFGAEAKRKLESLEQRDTELARLAAERHKIATELWRAGEELSGLRRKIIPKLRKAAISHLSDLGFKKCDFDVEIRSLARGDAVDRHISSTGLDVIEFQFAPNTGEPARPLRAIASSGEMARVMLALKTVLAAEDEIPVLIFDEVDANVGGETARSVGEKMRQISRQRQVLCITHLAPVAAAASTHYRVTKTIREGRTISDIQILKGSERIEEVARMLGGQTNAARKHAEELLGQ